MTGPTPGYALTSTTQLAGASGWLSAWCLDRPAGDYGGSQPRRPRNPEVAMANFFASLARLKIRASIRDLESTDFSEPDRPTTENHDLHVAGKTCIVCGKVITSDEPARLTGDHAWLHDTCHKPRH